MVTFLYESCLAAFEQQAIPGKNFISGGSQAAGFLYGLAYTFRL
jgi:hypothetical protein